MLRILLACILCSTACAELKPLSELTPLNKPVYSFPININKLLECDRDVEDYVAITRSVGLSGYWYVRQDVLDAAVTICVYANTKFPDAPPAGICLTTAPDAYGTRESDPTNLNSLWKNYGSYQERYDDLKSYLGKANDSLSASVCVTCVLIDTEGYRTKDDPVWNSAMDMRHNLYYLQVKQNFPGAEIIQFARGAVNRCAGGTGWGEENYHTLNELGDYHSVSLYNVPQRMETQETMRRTVEKARRCGKSVYVWVALGYHKQYTIDHPYGAPWSEECYDDYNRAESWFLGFQIHSWWVAQGEDHEQRFGPWSGVKGVVFWPGPFPNRAPWWVDHFVAYANGGHGVQ